MFLSPPVVAVVVDRVDVESASGEEGGERVRAVVAAGEKHQHAAGCPCGFAASRGGIELAGGAGELCGAPDGCVVASFEVGVEVGVVKKAGAWYTYEADQLGQGKENARAFLIDNPDLANDIEKKIREHYVPVVVDAELVAAIDEATAEVEF